MISLHQAKAEQEEEFFTEGTAALRDARMFLLEYSLPRARDRLEHERTEVRRPLAAAMQHRRDVDNRVKVRFFGYRCWQGRAFSYCAAALCCPPRSFRPFFACSMPTELFDCGIAVWRRPADGVLCPEPGWRRPAHGVVDRNTQAVGPAVLRARTLLAWYAGWIHPRTPTPGPLTVPRARVMRVGGDAQPPSTA